MRKLIILSFFMLSAITGCYPSLPLNNSNTTTQKPTMTPFQPEKQATPTPTVKASETYSPTTTSTPTPDPYIIFPGQESTDLSIGEMFISFYEGSLEDVTLSTYLISPKDLGVYKSTKDGLDLNNVVIITNPLDNKSVETHVSVIRPEENGNLLVSMHSGGYNNTLLDAESLRFYLERWGKNGDDYVLDRLNKISGSKGTLYFNSLTIELEAVGGVRVGPNDSDKINANPEQVAELVVNSQPETLGNKALFEELATSKDKHLLITFCGWGPENDYSYYRYIIVFKIGEIST